MSDQETFERIENYLLGHLNPGEKLAFEAEIAANPALAEEVKLQRLTMPALSALKTEALRTQFDQWKKELEETIEPAKTPSQGWKWMGVLLFFAGAGWFIWLKSHTSEPDPAPTAPQQIPTQEPTTTPPAPSPIQEAPVPQPKTQEQAPPPADSRAVFAAHLATEELHSIAQPMPGTIRGSSEETVRAALVTLDSLAKKGQFSKALEAAQRKENAIPDYYKLPRAAYLQHALGHKEAAVQTYLKYRAVNQNADQTDWPLALYYLSAYPAHQAELKDLLLQMQGDSKHPNQANADGLLKKLKKQGILK